MFVKQLFARNRTVVTNSIVVLGFYKKKKKNVFEFHGSKHGTKIFTVSRILSCPSLFYILKLFNIKVYRCRIKWFVMKRYFIRRRRWVECCNVQQWFPKKKKLKKRMGLLNLNIFTELISGRPNSSNIRQINKYLFPFGRAIQNSKTRILLFPKQVHY